MDAGSLGVTWTEERRKWEFGGLPPEENFEFAPLESLKNTLQNLFKKGYIVDAKLTSSTKAVA